MPQTSERAAIYYSLSTPRECIDPRTTKTTTFITSDPQAMVDTIKKECCKHTHLDITSMTPAGDITVSLNHLLALVQHLDAQKIEEFFSNLRIT